MNSTWIRHLPDFMRDSVVGRYNLQRLIGNTGWLLADRILRLGVGLFVGIWVARYLGPDQYGLFNYAGAIVGIFSIFASLGLDGVIVRQLVNEGAKKDEIIGTAFLLKFAGGWLTLATALAAILLLQPADALLQRLVVILAAGTIFQSFDVIGFWFQSRVESRFSVYGKGAAFILVSVIKVALILNNATLVSFARVASIEFVLGAIGLMVVYRLNLQHPDTWRVSLDRIRQTLRDAWPLALAGIAVVVYMKIDQIMLGKMLGNHAVGVYSAAIRLSEVWYFIPIAIVGSLTPSLIEARKAGEALYYKRLDQLFRLMSGIALAIAIPMTFASTWMLRTLYHSAYDGAGPVLAIHIWAALFVFLGVAQGPWDISEGLTKLALARTICGAIANIVLNLLLIPRYGPAGAAAATALSYALSAVLLNACSRRTRGVFLLQLNSLLVFLPGNLRVKNESHP